MTSPLAASLRWRERGHDMRFDEAALEPELAQQHVLAGLLRQHADTVFGREHGFGNLLSPRDFAAAVPIRDYEGFRPYVERQVRLEPRILTAEPPVMFTHTSGTTGAPKLIPVPLAWREQMAALMRLWMLRTFRDHPECFDFKTLSIVSPAVEDMTPSGMPIGAMSGVTYQRIPWVIRRQYALPYAVSHVTDYEARYLLIMRIALACRVSIAGTPNATTMIRLAEVAAAHGETIVKAVHDGTLGIAEPELLTAGGQSAKELRAALKAATKPDRERARQLAALLAQHGVLRPKDCWPDLKLLACWLGGSAGQHAGHLGAHYGEQVPMRDFGLLASEGRMTIPLADGTPAGALAVHANFYEFIAEGDIELAAPPVYLAHELMHGRRYYLIFTSGNGLYRYDMNDIVEVTGFHHRTPLVAFVRKGRDMLSLTGEKLHLNQVHDALRAAAQQSGLTVWQFRLVPCTAADGYDLLLETSGDAPGDEALGALLTMFDTRLGELNLEYQSKRASKRLQPPRLHLMRAGWSERQCRAAFLSGKREAQYKWTAMQHEWDAASRDEVVRVV